MILFSSSSLLFFFFPQLSHLPLPLPQPLPPVVASAASAHLFTEGWKTSSLYYLPSSIQHKQHSLSLARPPARPSAFLWKLFPLLLCFLITSSFSSTQLLLLLTCSHTFTTTSPLQTTAVADPNPRTPTKNLPSATQWMSAFSHLPLPTPDTSTTNTHTPARKTPQKPQTLNHRAAA